MRRLFAAAILATTLVAPAIAQPTFTEEQVTAATAAVKSAALAPEFDKLMWCAAAFGILSPYLKQNGQGDAAAEVEQLLRTVTTRASEAAVAASIAQPDFVALSESYTIYAGSQITTKGDYSQDQCTEAAR